VAEFELKAWAREQPKWWRIHDAVLAAGGRRTPADLEKDAERLWADKLLESCEVHEGGLPVWLYRWRRPVILPEDTPSSQPKK
jgi:hypothetical protein